MGTMHYIDMNKSRLFFFFWFVLGAE